MATLYKLVPVPLTNAANKRLAANLNATVRMGVPEGMWVDFAYTQPKNPAKGFQLQELYKMLDCESIEVINLRDGTILVCDEMPPEDTPVNPGATALYRRIGGDRIVGNALHCKSKELK